MDKKTQQAFDFITNCCRFCGSFEGTSAVNQYLKKTAAEMSKSKPSAVFPKRYIEHVAYAVDMVASNGFLSPPAAIASVYLATRFEFYFRFFSGKLNGDGTWISVSAQQATLSTLKDKRLKGNRISSVALAYKIMKLDQSRKIVKVCTALDNSLNAKPTTAASGVINDDIGDRIEFLRHKVGHGHWGDISSEALFYGLLTAVVFYNQT